MACQRINTGGEFLTGTLAHLDCQAQVIGSYGFAALADASSPVAVVLQALLTLFIAIFAWRLLFGPTPAARDAVGAVLKIGIVLTLATSWPAYRTMVYDVVLKGPGEVAALIMQGGEQADGRGLAGRLQAADNGIGALTAAGSGRMTGSLALDNGGEAGFRTIAMQDESALGWGRTFYLASTLGMLAVLRIAGGLLLALAPLFAGLLLFDFARGLFSGWLRGLVLVALGSLGIHVLLSVEMAVIEPWLANVLQRRALGYATPHAPTELIALTLAFAAAGIGLLGVLGRVAFASGWDIRPPQATPEPIPEREREHAPVNVRNETSPVGQAAAISASVSNVMRREELHRRETIDGGRLMAASNASSPEQERRPSAEQPRLGNSWRRSGSHYGASHARRDART